MRIALIGRPNVGKSTIFNRLVGSRSAVVGGTPGITRDRKCIPGSLFGLSLEVIDTPGVDTFSREELARLMNGQSLAALKESQVVLFVIDAIDGVTEYDRAVALWLRNSFRISGNREVIVVKNKSEKFNLDNVYELGFGDGIAISAEQNTGFDELFNALNAFEFQDEGQTNVKEEFPLKIAITGRPNVGKSTLINTILGENRLLTGDMAGITRDSISLKWKYKGRPIVLIDTAGQRRKSKVMDRVENASVADAWYHMKQAHVAVVLTDINQPLEKQDVTIARKALEEGKIVIFVLSKSDTVADPKSIQKSVENRLRYEFSQLAGVACLLLSSKEKLGIARIFNTAFQLYDKWDGRIPTASLNKWFRMAIAQNPPPLVNGMPIKLKYIAQTNTRPPTFAIFANRVRHLPASYERYLVNHLRKSFELEGVPIRLFIRQRENPFSE